MVRGMAQCGGVLAVVKAGALRVACGQPGPRLRVPPVGQLRPNRGKEAQVAVSSGRG
jgi:hypothetical protein